MGTRIPGTSFVQAKNYTNANRKLSSIRLIVLHCMQMAEKPTTAEDCARFFATTTKKASAHLTVDNNSAVQCVELEDVAWAAPGANHDGVQVELTGFAEQTKAQWLDVFGKGMFAVAAGKVNWLIDTLGINPRYVDRAGLLAGAEGITTHLQVSKAYGRSSHWDPGYNFPMGEFIEMVKAAKPLAPSAPKTAPRGRPVTVNGVTFFTWFAEWARLAPGQKFWAETIALQYKLNGYTTATGRARLVLDGDFGAKTEAFLRAWQYWAGMPEDGIVDVADAKKLGLTS